MRKTFLMSVFALLCALLAAGTAGADVFYTTESGTLGTIVIKSAESIDPPAPVVSSLGTNTSLDVSSFGVDGGTRVMVTKRSTGGDDTAVIYTPGTWTDSNNYTLTGTRNIHGTANARNGKSLYTASWGTASIVEYDNTSNYKATGRQYTYKPAGTAHAEDVLVGSSAIYGLFSVQSADTEGKEKYLSSRLVWMDGQLSDTVQGFGGINAGPNASEMAFLSDGRIAIAYRGNSKKGGIDLLSGGTISTLISGDVSGDKYGEIPTLCSDGDKGLYFVGQKLSDDISVDTLYRWKSDGTFSTLESSDHSAFVKVAWDDSNKLLVLARANKIEIFKDDKRVQKFESTQLDGTVSSMALTASAGSTDSGSSSNCDLLAPGSLALFLLPLTLIRRRKR